MIPLSDHTQYNSLNSESESPYMKLFPEFGSCFGGAPINPAAEPAAAADERQTAEQGVYSQRNRRQVKAKPGGGAAANWKPKLNAISENTPMTEGSGGGRSVRQAGIGNRKAMKVRSKSAPSIDRAEEYYYCKSAPAVAIPAFSPMSFMF